MTAGTQTPSPDEPDSQEEPHHRSSPAPLDPFTAADHRAEESAREFRRELRKQTLRGAAFGVGKRAIEEILKLLTEQD